MSRTKTEDPAPLSQVLREAREAAGLTQEQAAEKAGVSAITWRSWESGKRSPHWRRVSEIAAMLGGDAPTQLHLDGGLMAVIQWWPRATRKARAAVLATVHDNPGK